MTGKAVQAERPVLSWPTVVLRHELPDGSHHFDWLIAQDTRGEQELMCFRLAQRPDEQSSSKGFTAQRIGDHRPRYLSYQGPIDGGRGSVRQVQKGRIVGFDRTGHAPRQIWEVQVQWELTTPPASQHLRLEQQNLSQWMMFSTGMNPRHR